MILVCPACKARTVVPEGSVPPEGARARCNTCGEVSVFRRGGLVADDPTPPRGIPARSADELAAHATETPAQDPDATPPRGLPTPDAADRRDTPARPLPAAGLAALPPFPGASARPAPPPSAATAAPAAAAATPATGWHIRTPAGDEGPLPLEAVKLLIRNHRLGPDDLAMPPGATEHARAGDVADLKRYFALQKESAAPKTAAPAASVASCARHPGARAGWLCGSCGDLSCDACVVAAEVSRIQIKQCPACRGACQPFTPSKRITPFWEEMPELLKYPVAGLGWIGLIAFPLFGIGVVFARAAAMAVAIAWGAAAFLSLSIYAYHLYIIRDTTRGGRRLPNLGNVSDYHAELLAPAAKASLVSVLLFLPVMFASGGVHGAKLELAFAKELHQEALLDKQAWESQEAEREARGDLDSEDVASDDPESASLDDALAAFGQGDDSGDDGGRWLDPDRNYTAEEREARHAVAAAESRVAKRRLVQGVLTAATLAIWPIFLIVIALFNTIAPAFQPQILFRLIGEIRTEYGWCTLITSACFLGIWLANLPMRGMLVFDSWLTSPVTYYLSFIAFHVMGRTAELAEQKVDWH